jgi:multicomponent Na+:H+ antiporter subunit E
LLNAEAEDNVSPPSHFERTTSCAPLPVVHNGSGSAGGNVRKISLAVVLFLFWIALSGHYTPFLLAAGVGSAILCALVAARLRIADAEGHPVRLVGGALTYFPWLLWEIAKSAWAVTKIILHPRLPISPTMTKVMASQKTTAGIATYANSITLTPGTITTGVKGNVLAVHALVKEGAADLEDGGMDARVSRFEGRA